MSKSKPATPRVQHDRSMELIEAICERNYEQIDALLGGHRKIDLDVQQRGDAAVHMAARKGMLPVIKQLRRKGDNIGKQNQNGFTAAHYAAMGGYLDVVEFLQKCDVNLNVRNEEGDTPLHIAVIHQTMDVIEELVEMGMDPNSRNPFTGWTPVHTCANFNRQEALEGLLISGANPAIPDKNDVKPERLATSSCVREQLRMCETMVAAFRTGYRLGRDAAKRFGGRVIQAKGMKISHTWLSTPQTVDRVGIILESLQIPREYPSVFYCRREKRENTMVTLNIRDDEEVISDIFHIRISDSSKDVGARIYLPLYEAPSKTEQMVLVYIEPTSTTVKINDLETRNGTNFGLLETTLVPSITCVCVVCVRPRLEDNEVDVDGRVITSQIDESFSLDVPAGAFDDNTVVSLQVFATSRDDVLSNEEEDNITHEACGETGAGNNTPSSGDVAPSSHTPCSSETSDDVRGVTPSSSETSGDVALPGDTTSSGEPTCDVLPPGDRTPPGDVTPLGDTAPLLLTDVYQINLSGQQPQKAITVQIPLCAGCESWDDVAIVRTDENELEDDDALEVVQGQQRIVDCNVVFSVSHFCIYVACPRKMTENRGSMQDLQRRISDTRDRSKAANFFVVVQNMKSMKPVIIVECGRTAWVTKRLSKWHERNYVAQETRDFKPVMLKPGDNFYVDVQGEAELEDSRDSTGRKLTFSSWRSSYQPYQLTVPNRPSETPTTARAEVIIRRKSRGKNKTVAKLPIVLTLPDLPPKPKPKRDQPKKGKLPRDYRPPDIETITTVYKAARALYRVYQK